MLKLQAKQILPLDYDQEDLSRALATSLTKDDLITTLQAMGRTGEMGAMYYGYAHDVAQLLSRSDPDVVAAACTALGNMGHGAATFVGAVAHQLDSESSDVRTAAATAIGMFKSLGLPNAEALAAMTQNDKSEDTKCAAIGALGQIGCNDKAGLLGKLLENSSPIIVASVLEAFGELGSAGEEQAANIAKKLDDPQVRYAAISALSSLGDTACEPYVGEIISKCLEDADSLTRTTAAEVIGRLATVAAQSSQSMAKIAELLKHSHLGIQCSAALTFGYMGEKAAGQAEALIPLLAINDEDTSELCLTIGGGSMRPAASSRRPKCAALVALGLMGAKDQVAACAGCLDDDNWEVKMCALECLMQMGDEAKAHSSTIMGCLDDDVFVVRAKACECIRILEDENGLNRLPELFEDKAPAVRQAALAALAECPQVASEYAEEIFKFMLEDKVRSVQAAAIACLGAMGETGQCYASIIGTRLSDSDPIIRAAACEALGKLGDHGAAFAEEVAACLDDDAAEVRMRAARALGMMGEEGVPWIENIQILVDDPFGEVGTVAKDAVLALQDMN